MSLLDSNPTSKDYYTVRITTINTKTGVRSYKYTPATLLNGFDAITYGQRSRPQSTPGTSVRAELFMYDYGKHAWLPVPGFSQ